MQSYKKSITVKATRNAAYQALTTGFADWWTAPDVPITKVGDRAKFTFPPGQSYWTFEAVTLTPNERVVLECVDALHLHEGVPREIETEWLGTRAVWTLSQDRDGTVIDFEHTGLVPDLLCYKVCEAGWDFFFLQSLKAFLDTGTGTPHRPPLPAG